MRQTTSGIIGMSHRLCEWLRNGDVQLYQKVSTIPLALGVEFSTKWHVGNVDDLPSGLDRETIDSIPLRLPCAQMLIEADCNLWMADGSEKAMTGFALCYDTGTKRIDCFFFGYGVGRFWFTGGGAITTEPDGRRAWRQYEGYEQNKNDMVSAMKIVERTLVALSCNNVQSVDNDPPAALNKKRTKKGKLPLFTYKTLHIIQKSGSGRHLQSDDADDGRRSPRLHFRRGHVRKIGEGHLTWVQQCMVGDKKIGLIQKAYAINESSQSA
jgi:hypothetical protein